MSNKFSKNKSVQPDEKILADKNPVEENEASVNIESFEKTTPFITPIQFNPNIWTDAFLEWVKRFNPDQNNTAGKEDKVEGES